MQKFSGRVFLRENAERVGPRSRERMQVSQPGRKRETEGAWRRRWRESDSPESTSRRAIERSAEPGTKLLIHGHEVAAQHFSLPEYAVEFLDEFDEAVGILLAAGGFRKG